MTRGRTTKGRLATVAVGIASVAALVASPSTSAASTAELDAERLRGCDRQLDAAAEKDMQTFGNFEAEQWRAMHHPDAISVFASEHVGDQGTEIGG